MVLRALTTTSHKPVCIANMALTFVSGSHVFNHLKRVTALLRSSTKCTSTRCYTVAADKICTTPMPQFGAQEGIKSYEDLYRFSLNKPDEFWGTLARNRVNWVKDFDRVHDCDLAKGRISWFLNGKLNVSVNCVDRHYERTPDKVALIWEKDEPGTQEYITYRDLYKMMNQMANLLKSHEVKRGDRVVLYMPVSPLAVAAMLACARIGALHSVVFAGFSSDALANRIQDAGAETLITSDEAVRGGRVIPLKQTADDAVAKCPNIKRVFVAQRTGAPVTTTKYDISLEQEMAKQPAECEPEVMDSDDLLFLLYTSGSTGKPKGIAHSQGGYLVYANLTHQYVFDYQEGDVFGCVADIGWITGHSYVVYGPLSNGATTVLFESTPTYPDPGRYWETVERLKMNQIYLAPTALRLLLKFDDDNVSKYDRSTLRTLGCVGEPLNHEAWEWYYNVVGDRRCPIVDTWWQTETGGICITPRPSAPGASIKPASPMRPFFGIKPTLLDEKGHELTGNDVGGALCVSQAWPGLAKTIYGDHQRFIDTYFAPYKGHYCTGDGAIRDEEGYFRITGRMDDVINVTGHRLGTAEIEDIMDEHPMVAETAVVGFPHDVKGEGVYAYITLKDNVGQSAEEITAELKAMVRKQIAGYAVPEMIQISPGLPKTRSGKIMRRILRKVAANQHDELGDISTLADPSVVDGIIKAHNDLIKNK